VRRHALPPRLEALEDRTAPATFTVTSTADSGAGSLRQAILDANADPFVDTIAFSIGGGVQTIRPASQLPLLTKPVVVDGTTQPGYAGSPLVVLDGGRAGTSASGLTLTGGNSAVEGLVVNHFGGSGIVLSGLGGDSILGDYLGTDFAGTRGAGNNIGLQIDSANNVVGSTSPAARNLISDNQVGIRINGTGNVVLGNYIGTDATGTHALGDGVGVGLAGNGNQIGGTQAGARNVISGCASAGVSIAANGNSVQGNYIGTDATGTSALGNGTGVFLDTSQVNLLGGTEPGAGNLISGNGDGIALSNSTSNAIQGNFIGTNATGTTAVGNLRGVLDRSGSNAIGGIASGAGNVISGNCGNGVELDGLNSVVLGNKIGTDITGTTALPNNGDGIAIGNSFNHIGSVAATAGNLISSNGGNGIEIVTGVGDVIQGNTIGTDVTGTVALGNGGAGILFLAGADDTLGGTAAGAGNLISANAGDGITISGPSTQGIVVQGNTIGADVSGTQPLGNGGNGVALLGGAHDNLIGGTAAGAGNVIAFNGNDGVLVDTGTGNAILNDRIFASGNLGIELFNGGNNSQAAPRLASASQDGPNTVVQGTLYGAANSTYTVQLFSASADDPEAQTFLGTFTVTTDAFGFAAFTLTVKQVVPAGQVITATATDAGNDTSELSAPVTVTGP
jgi:titin